MASAAAIVAKRIRAQKSPCSENADHNATTESAPPAMGVHNPAQSNSPATPSIRIRQQVWIRGESAYDVVECRDCGSQPQTQEASTGPATSKARIQSLQA